MACNSKTGVCREKLSEIWKLGVTVNVYMGYLRPFSVHFGLLIVQWNFRFSETLHKSPQLHSHLLRSYMSVRYKPNLFLSDKWPDRESRPLGLLFRALFHKTLKTSLHRLAGLRKDVFMFYETEPWICCVGFQLVGGEDAIGKSGKVLQPHDIDAYWLQRSLSKYFEDPMVAQQRSGEVLTILKVMCESLAVLMT